MSQESDTEEAAGGVVFRRGADGVQIVLAEQIDRVSGARTVRLPKGKLEPGESPEAAALREVEEETGLVARIVEPLCEHCYVYATREGGRVPKRVRLFLMQHERGAPEARDGEFETVFWCDLAEAAARLTFDTERDAAAAAAARLHALYGGDWSRL